MNNTVLYRKYRPQNFDEVIGQTAIVQTLRNQIKINRIGNAYLFCGPKGSGKTSISRIFAKAVNCNNTINHNGNPCGNCEHCNNKDNVNPDVIEIDAASNNSVDNIRQLIDEVNYKPINSKYKIYIIDEIHMLSNSAFNALLKTVEEPPSHVIFIFATTELNKVPATIKSRCQIYNFKLISKNEIVSGLENILLKENISFVTNEILEYIASKAEGSMRDAIRILDQYISQHNLSTKATLSEIKQLFGDIETNTIIELATCIEQTNVIKGLGILHEQYNNGKDMKSLLDSLYHYYFEKFTTNFGSVNGSIFERYTRIIGETISSLDRSPNKMILVEIAFMKMCKPETEKDYNSVVHRMNNLEKELTLLKNSSNNVMSNNVNEMFCNVNPTKKEQIDEDVTLYYNTHWNHKLKIL